MDKKTEMQGFRTSKETKKDLVKVALHYGHLPGPFVACLVERFIDAHNKTGNVVWPPHYIAFDDFVSFARNNDRHAVTRSDEINSEQSRLLGKEIAKAEKFNKKQSGQQKGNSRKKDQ